MWGTVLEFAQLLAQDVLRAGGQAEREPPVTGVLLGQTHLVTGPLGSSQQGAGMREKHLIGRGELDLSGTAIEQHRMQIPFQRADLLGQRRCGDVQAAGSSGEVPLLGDCHEIPQPPQLHDRPP